MSQNIPATIGFNRCDIKDRCLATLLPRIGCRGNNCSHNECFFKLVDVCRELSLNPEETSEHLNDRHCKVFGEDVYLNHHGLMKVLFRTASRAYLAACPTTTLMMGPWRRGGGQECWHR